MTPADDSGAAGNGGPVRASAMDDWFAKHMPDLEAWAAQPVIGRPTVEPAPGGFLVPPELRSDLLRTALVASYIDVPNELLDGSAPRERRPIPWRWRVRNRIADWRERAARRAYKTIAGYWPDNGEGDW